MIYNKIEIEHEGVKHLLPPLGRTFTEGEELRGSREDFSADGTLRRDIAAVKKLFTLAYDLADQEQIDFFMGLLTAVTPPIMIVERHDRTDSYRVLLRPFSRERLLAAGKGLWSGLTLEFAEV